MNKFMKLKSKKLKQLSNRDLLQVKGGTGGGGDSSIPTQINSVDKQIKLRE
ncbi:hypothetical protein [Pseudoalteromonas sp. S16_S37]|uniref:hypothetical protein n=1 Tax=Pseudoalteromonas sp. S16_S37 TaxID=2720228 RepID=UPI001680E41B|nr:hypothetical protein [Pseudoalteromonas sp. S16_S37]MBD1582769.1 hypothetical protein [Pseudoalteromonas sp. S16_S37]